MRKLFSEKTIWNIFDYSGDPEWRWEILEKDIRAARRMAIRLTLRYPIRMLPVVAKCFKLEQLVNQP